MTRSLMHILRPVILWSAQFIALYALISASCAPRALIDAEIARCAAALVTAAGCVALMVWLLQDMRLLRRREASAPDRPLIVAACWSAGISGLALLANLWPFVTLAGCSG